MTWPATVTCLLCGADSLEITHHMRLFHPQIDAEPEVWSDGAVVVIDTTIEPEDLA